MKICGKNSLHFYQKIFLNYIKISYKIEKFLIYRGFTGFMPTRIKYPNKKAVQELQILILLVNFL